MEQMSTRAIMAVQLTGLYSQALIEWNGMPDAARTWDALKMHFTTAYIVREQSGTGTTGGNGYHTAANVTATDDTLNNIESTLNHELSNLQVANNAHHQSALTGIAELRAAITAAQQQIALLTVQAPAASPAAQPNATPRPNNFRSNRIATTIGDAEEDKISTTPCQHHQLSNQQQASHPPPHTVETTVAAAHN